MKVTTNINGTLKKALFDSPNPCIPRQIYNEIRDELFEVENEFIIFLTEKDSQKQVNVAKKILLRMSFSLPFSLPNRFVINLLQFESSTKSSPAGYVGQDHFVHSVYTYLLGLYVFFYHKGIHGELVDYFNHARATSAQGPTIHRKVRAEQQAIMDFAYCLKLFSITHDVGYPWEIAHYSSTGKHLKPFFKIDKSIEKDYALRVISNVIAFRNLLPKKRTFSFDTDTKGILLKNYELSSVNIFSDLISEDIKTNVQKHLVDIAGWIRLPCINGSGFARAVASIFPMENLVAVLESSTSEKPVIIIIALKDTRYILSRKGSIDKFGSASTICEAAFFTGKVFNSSQTWRYYSSDPIERLEKCVDKFFGSSGKEIIDTVSTRLDMVGKINPSMISTDREYKDYCFEIFTHFLSSFYYDKTSTERDAFDEGPSFTREFQLRNLVVKNKLLNFIDDISETLKEQFERNIKDVKSKEFDSTDIEGKMGFYLKSWKTVPEITKYLAGKISKKLESKLNEISLMLKAYETVRNEIRKEIPKATIFTNELEIPDYQLCANTSIGKKVSDKISGIGLGPSAEEVADILSNYKPLHIAKLDHGIASACLFMEVVNLNEKILQNIENKDPDDAALFLIALNVGHISDLPIVNYYSDTLLSESAMAIAMHNIFPKFLPGSLQNFRTSLDKAPFLYLCQLVDSFQRWDRHKQIDQADFQLPEKVTNSMYDIQIHDNFFYIALIGDDVELKKREESLRQNLDEYLEGASRLIKLKVSEFT